MINLAAKLPSGPALKYGAAGPTVAELAALVRVSWNEKTTSPPGRLIVSVRRAYTALTLTRPFSRRPGLRNRQKGDGSAPGLCREVTVALAATSPESERSDRFDWSGPGGAGGRR